MTRTGQITLIVACQRLVTSITVAYARVISSSKLDSSGIRNVAAQSAIMNTPVNRVARLRCRQPATYQQLQSYFPNPARRRIVGSLFSRDSGRGRSLVVGSARGESIRRGYGLSRASAPAPGYSTIEQRCRTVVDLRAAVSP